MNKSSQPAAEVACKYVQAMTFKDVATILSISALDIVCTSPLGQTTGVDRFRDFQDGFAKMVRNLTVVAVYGYDGMAVVVYDVQTHPVPHSRVVEQRQTQVHERDLRRNALVVWSSVPFCTEAYQPTRSSLPCATGSRPLRA